MLIADAGGVVRTFKLGANGKGKSGADTFALKLSKRGGPATIELRVQHGALAQTLSAVGLTNTTVTKQPVTIPVAIMFDGGLWTGAAQDVYSATKGKSGAAKGK